MPAVANITLSDALATPVVHTFVPMGPDASGVWWWEDQSASNPVGNNRISMSLVRPPPATAGTSSRDRVIKVRIQLYTPKLETVSNSTVSGILPAPVVGYVLSAKTEYVMSERATLQDRKDLRKFNDFVHADASVVALVETLLNIY